MKKLLIIVLLCGCKISAPVVSNNPIVYDGVEIYWADEKCVLDTTLVEFCYDSTLSLWRVK